ncbi:Hypothetical predicted protein, partial [Marmota monax]
VSRQLRAHSRRPPRTAGAAAAAVAAAAAASASAAHRGRPAGMRGESYFIGMRSLGQQGYIPEDGGLLLLCCIDRDWAVTRCFAEEAFQAITDFNDLPNSLFACNVHQSVFEGEESK